MHLLFRLALLACLLTSLNQQSTAQKKKRKQQYRQEVNLRTEMLRNWKLSDSFFMHYFVPIKAVTGYNNEGVKITYTPSDTFFVQSVDSGTINGITGNWGHYDENINLTYYIPFDNNLQDVTAIKSAGYRKVYYAEVSYRLLIAGCLLIPFLLIGLYAWRAAPERVKLPWR